MRNFGLIGYPLAHSFSKKYFAEKFREEKITECQYENHQLETIDDFSALIKTIENLEGLNVTVPYKESVIPFLDGLSASAKEIKAVNCIRFVGGKKIGYNTDVLGFKNSLLPMLNGDPDAALILGTGGASKAVAYVLKELKIAYHFVSRRPIENGYTYQELTEKVMKNHQLIVNTTPLGTYPKVEGAPELPYQYISSLHILHDLVYNPKETRFLTLGKERGAAIKNGYEMLVGQAEASWDIWNRTK